jgi:protein-tyrosine phosphatase
MTASEHVRVLSGSPAFRDLGGLPAADGRRIACGRLFRADALHSRDIDANDVLGRLGLRLVCDLRSGEEREFARCLHWLDPSPGILHLELASNIAEQATPWLKRMVQGTDPEAARALMLLTYGEMPRAAAAKLGTLFQRLAAGEWPVLIHCTAGKDRTGLTIASLLWGLGVPGDVVYDDYLRGSGRDPLDLQSPSSRFFAQILHRPLHADEARIVNGVQREFLDAAISTIEQEWGGVDGYLRRGIGLDDALITALRQQFLE